MVIIMLKNYCAVTIAFHGFDVKKFLREEESAKS
jgi:hypothetical protein